MIDIYIYVGKGIIIFCIFAAVFKLTYLLSKIKIIFYEVSIY